MPRGNDVIHNNHFHKHWQNRVKTWFNQPARKLRRSQNRKKKAALIAPRPAAGPLKPIVSCPTRRYNMKVRPGRGFSLQEIRMAGFSPKYARTIGISVDHRRRNKSEKGLLRNVSRLRMYKSRLIVLPRKATLEKIKELKQRKGKYMVYKPRKVSDPAHKPTDAEKGFHAFHAIRQHRADARLCGKRELRRKAAAE